MPSVLRRRWLIVPSVMCRLGYLRGQLVGNGHCAKRDLMAGLPVYREVEAEGYDSQSCDSYYDDLQFARLA